MIEKLQWVFSLPYKLFRYILIPKYLFLKNSRKENSYLEKKFINILSRYKIKWNQKNKCVVLTQIVEDYAICIKLAATANYIAVKNSSNIGLYSVYTKLDDVIYRSNSFWNRLGVENYYKPLSKIFLSFGGKVLHRNVYDYKNQKMIKVLYKDIRNQIFKKDDILKIHIENIRVGDLIYDTFLRYGKTWTADIQSTFLDKIIVETLNIYFNCKDLFSKYRVTALVNTYTTYIHHGVVLRMCLEKNIPVYTVGSHNSLVHRVIKEYPSHSNNHFLFPDIFKDIVDKNKIIAQAEKIFEKRFQGEIDTATSYMRGSSFSSYTNMEINQFDWSNTVVVLAHCFFDSPHIYRDIIFPDFYEWITYTLDILSKENSLNVLVKPHPNGIEGNDLVFAELKEKYSNRNITFIDPKTSNIQLIQSRPKALITAYGTPAYEFAYYGIPVICVYDNPFIAYHFTKVANTIDEYGRLLTTINEIQLDQKREEILEYYYMQHLFFMNGREGDYLMFSKYRGKTYSDDFLEDYMPLMNESYFNVLNESIKDGFALSEFEQKYIL